MIETKLFEVRDSMTFIPIMATLMVPDRDVLNVHEYYLLRRAGFAAKESGGRELIQVTRMQHELDQTTWEPHNWRGGRTMKIAHEYIEQNWDSLKSGQVICVEHIMGERISAKESELNDDDAS